MDLKKKWTQEEKNLLEMYINGCQDGKHSWVECSQAIKTKSPRQCYDQYVLQLYSKKQQNINHKWTHDEANLLLQFPKSNMTWQQFQSQHFQGLSVSQLKNKYKKLVESQQKPPRGEMEICEIVSRLREIYNQL